MSKLLYTVPTEARHDMRASGVIVAAKTHEGAYREAKTSTQDYQVPPVFDRDSVRKASAREVERSTAFKSLDEGTVEPRYLYIGLD
jgi:hypothetical protein